MRKINIALLILAVIVMLSACSAEKKNTEKEEATKEIQVIHSGELAYSVEKIDTSRKESSDEVTLSLEQYYELVKIEEDSKAAERINKYLKAEYNDFSESETNANEYFDEDLLNLSESRNYENTISSDVVMNDNNIFCVKHISMWNMGGVSNSNTWGETYQIEDGKKMTLPDVLGMSEDDTKAMILKTVRKNVEEEPDRWDGYSENPVDAVDSLSLEQIDFYVERGEIYICFETYLIGSGALGCVVLPLDMEIEEEVETEYETENETESGYSYLAEIIGETIGDVKNVYGWDFREVGWSGSYGIRFDSLGMYFGTEAYENLGNDDVISCVIAFLSNYPIFEGLYANMTYPEITSIAGDVGEPEYFYSEEDEMWEYTLRFNYNGYEVNYLWYDVQDINTDKTSEAWITKE